MTNAAKDAGNLARAAVTTKATNAAAGTTIGAKMGIKPAQNTPEMVAKLDKAKKRLAAAGTVAAAGIDAAAYSPPNGGNVWDTLQG